MWKFEISIILSIRIAYFKGSVKSDNFREKTFTEY